MDIVRGSRKCQPRHANSLRMLSSYSYSVRKVTRTCGEHMWRAHGAAEKSHGHKTVQKKKELFSSSHKNEERIVSALGP